MNMTLMISHQLRSHFQIMLRFLAIAALAMPSAQAADFPPEQIRIVVPYSAGGGTDVIARLVAQHMSEAWKVTILIDNRVGAGGVVGSNYVTQQKPDGRTFLAVASAFAVRAAIDRSLPYDATKDFAGVGQMAISPSFMVVSPSLGFKSLKDLIAYAKAQPAGIFYTSAGVGSTAHLHAAAVAHLAGLKAEHVPNKGTPQAVTEAMTGRVLYAFAPGPNAIPLAKAGKLQILVTTSPAGARFMPGVPSIAEAGLAYEGDDWFGVYAPLGTPLAIRERFSKEMARVLALPEVRERLATLGAEPVSSTPQEYEKMAREYIAKARKLGDEIGIKVE
ncbi:MAG: tripartite tricarboxylate transporter substrate-binding protein [Burkholderiales bacterium]|nr:tripartite tricarboxylate transporter substrate-binding protein [Burkholderiales bacterium]